MSSLAVYSFNSNKVRFENRDGRVWVSLTDMAKASGKLIADWNRLKATAEFLTEFEGIMGFPIMVSNVGGAPETTGTWAIEEVAIKFAAWCSIPFEIWMLQQIKTLMTEGTVSLPQVEQRQLPQNYLEALKALVAAEEEKALLLADNQVMAAKIDLDAPLVSYANAVEATDDAISFNAFAKMINTGRTRLFRQMRECGVILKDSTLPYQKWVDAGYFEVSQTIETVEGKLIPFALVTGKGQLWLHQRLQKASWLEKVEEAKQAELPFDNI